MVTMFVGRVVLTFNGIIVLFQLGVGVFELASTLIGVKLLIDSIY
jgi:hypothetical protein